jgi:hypothetical protein
MPKYKPKNLALIKAHADQDDKAAKEILDDLDFESGTPNESYAKQLWAARWEAFYEEKHPFVHLYEFSSSFQVHMLIILNCRIDRTPTISDLETFLCGSALRGVTARPSALAPPGTPIVPSVRWFQICMEKVMGYLIFKYPDWQLNEHGKSRIKELTAKLRKEGKLTAEPMIIKLWAGLEITRLLVKTIWKSSSPINNVSLARIVTIVLNSALIARASGFLRPRRYGGLECLLWKQVLFVFKDGVRTFENLFLVFTVATKGADREMATKMTFDLKSQEKNRYAPMVLPRH